MKNREIINVDTRTMSKGEATEYVNNLIEAYRKEKGIPQEKTMREKFQIWFEKWLGWVGYL